MWTETNDTTGSIDYGLIGQSSTGGLWVLNPEGVVLSASARLASAFGTTPDILVGRPFTDFFVPQERDAVRRMTLEPHDRSGIAREWQLCRPDGSTFSGLLHTWPVMDQGRLLYYGSRLDPIDTLVFTRRDERLLGHAALAMNLTQEGMALLQADGTYIWMNPSHADMYGWVPEDLVGRTWRELYSPDEIRRVESAAFTQLAATGRWRGELVGLRRDGSSFDVEVSLAQGLDGMLVCCCRDITDRKREHELLRKALSELDAKNDALRKAVTMKDIFLACMSHELRTPLHAILGTAELLSTWPDGQQTEKQQHYLAQIRKSGDHLLALINDILDVSKISAGQVTLDLELTPVSYLFSTAVDMVMREAEGKHIRVSLPPPHPDPRVLIDRRRGVQIFVNLLSNAVKFTSAHGHIRIEVTPTENTVDVSVIDDGCGFPSELAERLFEPFVQLDGSLRRAHGGTGLGLYLARQLAELHRGHLTAASAPNRGATFTVRLPLLSWE